MRRILLVDDDVHLTHIVKKRLERVGFDVRVSNRSLGVLNLVASTRPDVVLMDMKMPGLQGGEVLTLLRRDPELKKTRVLLYSGIAAEELRSMCTDAGADGFVHKTEDFSSLVSALRK